MTLTLVGFPARAALRAQTVLESIATLGCATRVSACREHPMTSAQTVRPNLVQAGADAGRAPEQVSAIRTAIATLAMEPAIPTVLASVVDDPCVDQQVPVVRGSLLR